MATESLIKFTAGVLCFVWKSHPVYNPGGPRWVFSKDEIMPTCIFNEGDVADLLAKGLAVVYP